MLMNCCPAELPADPRGISPKGSAMRIPVDQISEAGWSRTLDIPLASLPRIVESFGPQQGTLRAQVTLKNHRGCVDVRGSLAADVRMACGVCLDEGTVRVEAPLELMVAPEGLWKLGHKDGPHEEVRLSPADLDVSFYESDEIDLTAVLEEELLIAAPVRLAEEDADGNCTRCRRNVDAMLAERQGAQELETEFNPFRELAERIKREAAGAPAESGTIERRDPPKRTRAKRNKTGS